MHIVHVTSFYSVSALTPSSAVQARGIAYRAAGHEFSVIVPGTISSVTWTEYGTVVTVPARGAALRRGFVPIPIAVCRALDRLVPDRLEVADRLSFRQLGVWAVANQVPAVLFADDVASDLTLDGTLVNYDRVVHGAQGSQPHPASANADKFLMMEQGVDLEIFTPLRHNSALRDSSGAELIVVCAAPLTASGSVVVAINSVRKLVEEGAEVHLVIVGDGPLRSRLERSSFGLSAQFLSAHKFTLAERSEVFATADFALVTTSGAAGHSVALEALASGTPVIWCATTQHRIDLGNGGGMSTVPEAGHIASAVAALSKTSVESRRRAARDIALQFDAMPLTRAMVKLHESLGQ